MYIDTHAHLTYPDFANELPQLIDRAQAAGVGRMVTIATNLDHARRALELAQQFPSVYASIGLHPGDVPDSSLCDMGQVRTLATQPKVVAIGETGLDYYREAKEDHALRQQQKDLFWAHLDLARELGLPVVIHNRAAETDILEILKSHAASRSGDTKKPWGVMHCFSGTLKFARECLEIGLLISYTGILTFKSARTLHETAAEISLEQVMLETDAPYLAPDPNRGMRNEPAYVPLIARALAELKNVRVEEVEEKTTRNAERFFSIK